MAATSEAKNIEIIDDTKNTNLHMIALNGDHQELAKFKAGSTIDVQNTYGLTPLMLAARYGHLEAIKTLLDLRADATKVNKYGGSVFLMAVASGNLDAVNILLQHLLSGGVSRQAIETQFSPIALSILFGHEHVFKFLLGSKFNVKSVSLYTYLTPLMFAALNENPVFTQHLLMMGADTGVRNANNETCHDLERRLNGPPESPENPPPTNRHHNHQLKVKITQPEQLQPQQSPMIIVSPQPPPYYNLLPLPRKSSNTFTPDEITPTISPVGFYPQIFFPADFTPSQFASPTYLISRSYSPYNQDYIVSPVFGMSGIPSPYPNVHNMNVAHDYFMA